MKHWRGIDRQVGEHRISFIQLSATAPLRDHCTEWYTTQVLRVVRRHFTPDSFHSLPLRRGSEASSRCRALSDLGLPVPYSFYTFNFPTPATLAPPLYSLCSFFLEQSDDRMHLRNFPLRLSLMQPTSLQFRWPLFRRCAAPRPMAEACQVSGASNLSSLRISC